MRWTRRDVVALLRDRQVRSISRRYFVSNGFDGTLTSVGIAMGALLSGVPDGRTAFVVGLGVGLLFVFGAYMARIAGLSWYVAGIRMGLAGVIVAGINLLLPSGGP